MAACVLVECSVLNSKLAFLASDVDRSGNFTYRRHRQKGSGLHSPLASEDHVLAVNQDRIGEAEDPDAVGDLPDLFARMSARVAPIGLQIVGRDILN
jgi:hypothetical protein